LFSSPQFQRVPFSLSKHIRSADLASVLIISRNAPNSYRTIDAIASFRDLISISVITRARALVLKYERQRQLTYSDTFALYPWTLDKNYEYLTSHTPSGMSMHVVERFRGQSSPEISMMSLQTNSLDRPLMLALLKRWQIRYSDRSVRWNDRALFRSLNHAYRVDAHAYYIL
jgi:hypothetical protein